MEQVHPECQKRLEESKLQWDMKAGDAILWDRWAFHRTVPAAALQEEAFQKSRYSVRYMPASAKVHGAVHWTIPQGSRFDSPYYPQVWPNLIESEVRALEHGLESDVTITNVFRVLANVLVDKIRSYWKCDEKPLEKNVNT